MKVWLALFNPDTYESFPIVLSVHKTEGGAKAAVRKSREGEYTRLKEAYEFSLEDLEGFRKNPAEFRDYMIDDDEEAHMKHLEYIANGYKEALDLGIDGDFCGPDTQWGVEERELEE